MPRIPSKLGLRVQNEVGQMLGELCQEKMQVIANTFFFLITRERTLYMNITRLSTLNQIYYVIFSQRWRSSLDKSAKTRHGPHCGSNHQPFNAKFRLKLKKVGESTRPFKYDLNQTSYDYSWK